MCAFDWRDLALAADSCLEDTLGKVIVDLLPVLKAFLLASWELLHTLQGRVVTLIVVKSLTIHAFHVDLQ